MLVLGEFGAFKVAFDFIWRGFLALIDTPSDERKSLHRVRAAGRVLGMRIKCVFVHTHAVAARTDIDAHERKMNPGIAVKKCRVLENEPGIATQWIGLGRKTSHISEIRRKDYQSYLAAVRFCGIYRED